MDDLLLIRYISGNCLPEEARSVEQWIAVGKVNANRFFELERIWGLKEEARFSDKKEIESEYLRLMNRLEKKDAKEKKRKPALPFRLLSISQWVGYAAAVVLLGLLSFHLFLVSEKEEMAFNTLEVPRGQRVTLTLSDGTKVWLNSQSKLVYPSGFLSDVRKVYLEGEAYFEVTRNEQRPFIVQLPLVNVKVLGTTFNVRAYGKEETAVTLATGRVEVSLPEQTDATKPAGAPHSESVPAKILLSPRQQITYSTGQGFKLADDIDVSDLKPWTSGQFFFRDQPLARIAQELERCFDVRISIRDTALASEIFTCHTRPGASLDQILDILKETRRLDYVKEENHILVVTP